MASGDCNVITALPIAASPIERPGEQGRAGCVAEEAELKACGACVEYENSSDTAISFRRLDPTSDNRSSDFRVFLIEMPP